MRPEQLPLIPSVSAPVVHPDGTWACVSVEYPNLDADAYVAQLWRVPLDGSGPPRRITRGLGDKEPRFSPDGRLLAFLRRAPGGKPQLHLERAAGGEPMPVTDQALGVGEFAFSDDSARLAFCARVPEEGRYGTVEGVDASAEDARHFTDLKLQQNGLGWHRDRPAQVFVLPVPDVDAPPPVPPAGRAAAALKAAGTPFVAVPSATQVTQADTDHGNPVFVPDHSAILAVTSLHDSAATDLVAQLYRFDLAGGDPEGPLGELSASSPCFTPDGSLFWLGTDLGPEGLDFVGTNAAVCVTDASGTRRLTDPELLDPEPEVPLVPAGQDAVLVVDRHRGASRVVRVAASGETSVLLSDTSVVIGAAAVPDRSEIVVTRATATAPGEVCLVRDGVPAVLTDFSRELREATPIVVPTEVTASSGDGYEVHGWVAVPPGEGPHPVLLSIHGGPYSAYTTAFFDEVQVWTEAGYAVVYCNPRGSAGYGPGHGRAIRGAFGSSDATDVLAFLDHCLATNPSMDADRVGILGGSYGGFLTAWLIGTTDRFAAAVVERGYLDPASFVGASDIGWYFPDQYHTSDPARQAAQSPMLLTDRVRTPTLVIHSELDLRCPLSQALRYYTRLKQAGVDAELLVFPGENHELSRSGTPQHRLQRFRAMLDWWERWLPVGGPPAQA